MLNTTLKMPRGIFFIIKKATDIFSYIHTDRHWSTLYYRQVAVPLASTRGFIYQGERREQKSGLKLSQCLNLHLKYPITTTGSI